MAFESINEFISMGTHGLYVWSVYGISLILLLGSYLASVKAKKNQIKRLKQRYLREQKS
ncbi:heme exporter protein CcmD [Marinomonas sp. PE14-40]|uniref:heme exporter protein CcmD n=1 Tax=Marinomonas sp. PE14-40 TaxID=3060621 RepID=UPI003F66595E